MSRNEPTPAHKRILDTSDGHLRRAEDWRELVARETPGGFETDHEHEQFVFKTLRQIAAETQATQMKLIHERAVSEQATVSEALDVLHETVKPVHVELPDRPEFDRPGLSDYVDYMGPVIEPKLRISGLHARAKRELALRTPSDAKLIAEPSEEQVEQFAPMTSIAFDDEESRTGAIKKFKGEKKRADASAKSPYGSKDLVELEDGSYVHVTDSETRKLGFLDDLRASCGDDHLAMIDMLMNKLMIEPNEELRDVGMAHLDDMKAYAEGFAQCVAISLDTARSDAYETEFGASPLEDAGDCFDQFMISSWFLLRDMKHMRSPQLKELSVGDRLALAKEVRDVSEALMSAAFFKETKDMDKGADKILFYQKAFGLFESLSREAGDMDRAN